MHLQDREIILTNLREKVARGEPILITAAGLGLIAKIANAAKVDLIVTTAGDYYRMDGHPTAMAYFAYGNANTQTLDRGPRILKMAKDVPVVVGMGVGDPYREIDELADEYWRMGFSGYINAPVAAMYGPFMENHLKGTVLSLEADAAMISMLHRKNRLTIAIAVTAEHARVLASAGADLIVAFTGFTVGGLAGAPTDQARTLDQACAFVQEICDIVKEVNPESLVVCSGGPLDTPEAVQYCFDHTDAAGFFGSSATDRLPMEEAVCGCVERFEKLRLEAL